MKEIFKKFAWVKIILGVLIATLGIIIIAVSLSNNEAKMTEVICIIFGIYVSLVSLLGIFFGLLFEAKKQQTINIVGLGSTLAIGLVFIIFKNEFAAILLCLVQRLIPMVLVCGGGILLVQAIIEIATKMEKKIWIPRIIVCAIFLASGITLFCIGNDAIKVMYVIVGAVCTVIGLTLTVLSIINFINSKNEVAETVEPNEANEVNS